VSTALKEQQRLRQGNEPWRKAFVKAQRLGAEELRGVVITRSLEAILKCVEAADAEHLKEIASAPTNYEVLLRQLTGSLDVLRNEDPLAKARLRGVQMKEDLLNRGGGAVTAAEAGKLLKLTRQAVDKRRKARKLLALEFGKRGHLYPAFQFDEQIADNLQRVLTVIDRRVENWTLLAFFLNGNRYLKGATPLEWLREGKLEEVLRAAKAYGEHGAA